MKKALFLSSLLFILISFGCSEDDDPTTSGNSNSNPCNSLLPNKLSAKINGAQWCADTLCWADLGIIMTINGMSFNGASMTLELDNYTNGNHAIGETDNHVIYIDNLGMAWESTDDNPGILTITSNDTATNHLKANFNAALRNPLTGASVTVSSGLIDVYYTE